MIRWTICRLSQAHVNAFVDRFAVAKKLLIFCLNKVESVGVKVSGLCVDPAS